MFSPAKLAALVAAAYLAAAGGVCHAQAQSWPTKPIRTRRVPAVGPTDVVARRARQQNLSPSHDKRTL
jgi:hypothetical protein